MKTVGAIPQCIRDSCGPVSRTWIVWHLRKTMAVGLVVVSTIIYCAAPVGGKEQSAETQVPTQMDFQKWLEKTMEDWPEPDLSTELPLDSQVHAETRNICDEIRRATEEELKHGSWPNAKIILRSISYVLRDSRRYVEASYSSRSDTKAFNPEVIWEDTEFEIRDGGLRFRPPSSRIISPFANVMLPIIRQQALSIPQSRTYKIPITWPVSDQAHQELTKGVNYLLELYLNELKDFLEDSDKATGRIKDMEYAFWFEEGYAHIRVIFDISIAGGRSHDIGVKLDFKKGKFRLVELIQVSVYGGHEHQHVGFAGNSAMDSAVEKWLRESAGGHIFPDARVGPPFPWLEATKELPEGLGRIVQIVQRSHPFLGEHHRRFRIECSDGRIRTFRLRQDGGDITQTEVFLVRMNGKRYIRLRDGRITNYVLKPNGESWKLPVTEVVIAVDSLSICSPVGLAEGELLFNFKE